MFEQISILVKIYKSEFSKNFDCFENFEKFRFWSNFRKISILVKIFGKFRFFSKISKNSDFSQIF